MIDAERVETALADVRNGNREAFQVVVQETISVLRAYVNFFVHNNEAASDILQDVYIQVYQQVDRYQPGTNCVGWIKALARSAALTARKSFVREQGHLEKYRVEAEDQMGEWLDEKDQQSPVEGRMGALRRCIEQLTEKTRAMLELYYFKKQPMDMVARGAGMSPNAASVTLHRARQSLAKCVESGSKRHE